MPNNVDDFRDSNTLKRTVGRIYRPRSNGPESVTDPNPVETATGVSRAAFLIGLDIEAGLHYRSILEKVGMTVFEFKNRDDGLGFLKQSWPALVMLPFSKIQGWAEKIIHLKDGWRLLPDHVLLVDVKDYLEKEINGFDSKQGEFDFVGGVFPDDVSLAPLVVKTVLHPSEPQEIFFLLETLFAGRRVRAEHLHRQRLRSIYKHCADLASMQGRSPLLSAGLTGILDVTSASGGIVFKQDKKKCRVEYLRGMEHIKLEKTLEFLHDQISFDSDETKWILFPQSCAKSRKKRFSLQGVVLSVEREESGFLRILVFPGKTAQWPENKVGDVELILEHIRLGLKRMNERELGVPAQTRDIWTGLPEEELLVYTAEKKLLSCIGESAPERSYNALIVVDLDGFTEYNRREGHLRGGVVIRNLARRLLNIVGGLGTLGRTGPDEFTVALHCVTPEMVEKLCVEMHKRVRSEKIPAGIGDGGKRHTITVGYAMSEGKDSARSLLCKAREMLDAARKEGGDRVMGFRRP